MLMCMLNMEKEVEVVIGTLIPLSYLCLYSLTKWFIFMIYEAIESSRQSGFQKFGILSKKWGEYGKIV